MKKLKLLVLLVFTLALKTYGQRTAGFQFSKSYFDESEIYYLGSWNPRPLGIGYYKDYRADSSNNTVTMFDFYFPINRDYNEVAYRNFNSQADSASISVPVNQSLTVLSTELLLKFFPFRIAPTSNSKFNSIGFYILGGFGLNYKVVRYKIDEYDRGNYTLERSLNNFNSLNFTFNLGLGVEQKIRNSYVYLNMISKYKLIPFIGRESVGPTFQLSLGTTFLNDK